MVEPRVSLNVRTDLLLRQTLHCISEDKEKKMQEYIYTLHYEVGQAYTYIHVSVLMDMTAVTKHDLPYLYQRSVCFVDLNLYLHNNQYNCTPYLA
jgi:hypothetical protein